MFINSIKYFIFSLFFFFLCGVKITPAQNDVKKISLKGILKNPEKNTHIYIYEIDVQGIMLIDSVKVNKKGVFTYASELTDAKFLLIRTKQNEFVKLMCKPDDNILVKGSYFNLSSTYTVKGSEESELIRKIDSASRYYNEKLNKMLSVLKEQKTFYNIEFIKDSIEQVYKKDFYDFRAFLLHIIENNPFSLACLTAINQNFGQQVVFSPEKDRALYVTLSENLTYSYPNNKHSQFFMLNTNAYIEALKEKEAIENRVGVGKAAPEITLLDKNKNFLSLSDYKGKLVLLKFWNPNCDLCRDEIKALIPLYEKYKEKGFEVFAVSIGTNRFEWLVVTELDSAEQWVNVKIPEEGDNIPNLNSYYVWLYGIKSVPFTFFINREGIIVRKGFANEEVEEIINEYLK